MIQSIQRVTGRQIGEYHARIRGTSPKHEGLIDGRQVVMGLVHVPVWLPPEFVSRVRQNERYAPDLYVAPAGEEAGDAPGLRINEHHVVDSHQLYHPARIPDGEPSTAVRIMLYGYLSQFAGGTQLIETTADDAARMVQAGVALYESMLWIQARLVMNQLTPVRAVIEQANERVLPLDMLESAVEAVKWMIPGIGRAAARAHLFIEEATRMIGRISELLERPTQEDVGGLYPLSRQPTAPSDSEVVDPAAASNADRHPTWPRFSGDTPQA